MEAVAGLRRLSVLAAELPEEEFLRGCKLLCACSSNDFARVKAMIEETPALTGFADYDRRTALHVAASEGHLELVNHLLDKGANPNRSDRWGGSPLDDAQRHRFPDVAIALRERGAALGVRDHGAALIQAAFSGDHETIQQLLADGAAVDADDYDSRTAMHLAASEGHETVVKTLLASKAEVNVKDRWGGSPLDDALRRGHAQCVELLKLNGATPSAAAPSDGPKGGGTPGGAPAEEDSSLLVDWEDIAVLENIGSGAFGDIVKCRWRGTLVAAKVIKSGESLHGGESFSGNGVSPAGLRADAVADFRQEISFLGKLRHPNICLLLGFSLLPNSEVMIVELMKCSLQDVLKTFADRGTPFSLERTVRYAIQFAQGMNFLHTSKPPILHRDLKPANLLLDFADVCALASRAASRATRESRCPWHALPAPMVRAVRSRARMAARHRCSR
jgi:hypothetical protein